MAEGPENLTPVILREMRENLTGIRVTLIKYSLRLESLVERLDLLGQSVMIALGFSTEAGVDQKQLEKRVDALQQRLEKLEKVTP